jgi:hypothetical protein
MGYNFIVSDVGVKATADSTVTIDVTVKQIGVAPFYYPLSLLLGCTGLDSPLRLDDVNSLVEKNAAKVFSFANIPATSECLSRVQLNLDSAYAYESRPIKFSQGADGSVALNIPMPPIVVEPIRVNFSLVEIVDGVSSGFRSIENGTTFDLADVGFNLSIQANVNKELSTGIEFQYGDSVHFAPNEPFAAGGLENGEFVPVQYLTEVGRKTLHTVILDEEGKVASNVTITFRITDTSSPLTLSPTPSPSSMPTALASSSPTAGLTLTPSQTPTRVPTPIPTKKPVRLPVALPAGTEATAKPTIISKSQDFEESEKANMTALHGFNTHETPPQLNLQKRQSMWNTRTIAIVSLGSLMLFSLIAGIICCMILRKRRRKDFGKACDESIKDDQVTLEASTSTFSNSFTRSQSSRTIFDDDTVIAVPPALRKPAFTFMERPALTRNQQSLRTVYDDDKTVASITYNRPKRLKNVTRVSKEDKMRIDQLLRGNESYV